MSTFGERLEIEIKRHDMTNSEFSVKSTISKHRIFEFFINDAFPSRIEFESILRALPRTDARWLICGENDEN